jgi:hypothetical protein
MKIELCTVTCRTVQFRVLRHVVELESHYITLSTKRTVSSRKFQSIFRTCGESMRLSGQQVVLLMNEDFGPYPVGYKTIQHLRSAEIGNSTYT